MERPHRGVGPDAPLADNSATFWRGVLFLQFAQFVLFLQFAQFVLFEQKPSFKHVLLSHGWIAREAGKGKGSPKYVAHPSVFTPLQPEDLLSAQPRRRG